VNYLRCFQEVGAGDVGLVGGKGANLGEMTQAALPVPPGFCLTAAAYRTFIRTTGLNAAIHSILAETHADDLADVAAKTARIQSLITEQEVPAVMVRQVLDSYDQLARRNWCVTGKR
jgi:pyruvate,water dikinase